MNTIQKKLETLTLQISKLTTFKEKINVIADYAKVVTGAERCSLFIFEKDKEQLVSICSDGVKGSITLKSNIGLVGYAFHKRKTVLENDVEHSPLFFKLVDKKLNYKTNTILAVPIMNQDNTRLGILQLLNKQQGFTEEDKVSIESLTPIIALLFDTQETATNVHTSTNTEEISDLQKLQNSFDSYLEDKKLFLMEDGSAYYKILNMKREYFIGADKCYQLTPDPQKTTIYYYSVDDEFLSINVLTKIDSENIKIMISENISLPHFKHYSFEKDEV